MVKKPRDSKAFMPVDQEVRDMIDALLEAMPPPRNDPHPRVVAPKKTPAQPKRHPPLD